MVWVYDRTESLLLLILMHASLIASTLIVAPPATGLALLTWILVWAVVLWVVVAVIVVANRWRLGSEREKNYEY